MVARLGPRDHVSNVLRDLHWLPVQHRITYKLCLCIFTTIGRHPTWSTVSPPQPGTASLSYRGRLRSANSQRYEQPRTRLKFGERCFAFAGPAAWNSLPSSCSTGISIAYWFISHVTHFLLASINSAYR